MTAARTPPQVMGIVNVTPDSFSDGGRFNDVDAAIAHGLALIEAGADILDIGGESTRPGAVPVSESEELERVLPVIAGIRARSDIPISIDTMKPEVAQATAAVGASMWNDVNGLRVPGALTIAASLGIEVVIMHMAGEPRTMQAAPEYVDAVEEVTAFLCKQVDAAKQAGLSHDRIWVDPGVGFGKTLEHNLALMRALPEIERRTACPVLLGASRKRFIAALDPSASEARDRLGGSLATALWGARVGAGIVRVHDVRETKQALTIWSALEGGNG